MKVTLIFLLTLICFKSAAFKMQTSWSETSEKLLDFACIEGEPLCRSLCSINRCLVKEKVCRNCVGTSISMSFIFSEMGKLLVSTSDKLDDYALLDLIRSKKFVTLTANSVYNLVDKYDSRIAAAKFQSLCLVETSDPTVFFHTDEIGQIGEIHSVVCSDGVYRMERIY